MKPTILTRGWESITKKNCTNPWFGRQVYTEATAYLSQAVTLPYTPHQSFSHSVLGLLVATTFVSSKKSFGLAHMSQGVGGWRAMQQEEEEVTGKPQAP
jgi:hypothetical protein